MDPAVDVRVLRLVVAGDAVDDRLRLLAGGGVVQVNQRFAVDLSLQGGEVLADLFHTEPDETILAGHFTDSATDGNDSTSSNNLPCGNHAATSPSRCLRMGAIFIRSRHSSAKAKSSRARAASRPIPRERR